MLSFNSLFYISIFCTLGNIVTSVMLAYVLNEPATGYKFAYIAVGFVVLAYLWATLNNREQNEKAKNTNKT